MNQAELIVEIGKLNPHAENDWELFDLSDLEFKKPTVFCLSGNGAINNHNAKNIAKLVETYLDLLFKTKNGTDTLNHVDIMSIKYAPKTTRSDTGSLTDEAILQITDALLALLVNKNNKIDLNIAKRNMSRVTFFTYCAGDAELQRIFKVLKLKLLNSGYSEEEVIAINRATLNVSFAPLDYRNNLIPSVNVISINDNMVSEHLGHLLTSRQIENLDGIYLHQDQPGSLYGVVNHKATAGSIQIISSGLINSYTGEVDDHNVAFVSREKASWNIKPRNIDGELYQAHNADCVSEMMAWALCKGVENSIQNFQAQTYVANTYWDELKPDLKSIIHSYGHEKLARNPLRATKLRKENFDTARYKKQLKMAQEIKTSTPTKHTVISELNTAIDFQDVMETCEKYNYLYTNDLFTQFEFLTEDEKLALRIAQANTINRQAKKTASKAAAANIKQKFQKAQCFQEVMKLAITHLQDAIDCLTQMKQDDTAYAYSLSHEEFEYIKNMVKQEQAKQDMKKRYSQFYQMESDIKNCEKTLPAVLQVFDNYNYAGAIVVLHKLDFLTDAQRALIRKIAKIKADALTAKTQSLAIPSYEEMVHKLNHANSLAEAVAYLKDNDFLGVEHVLPAVQVLTQAEKEHILAMAGIKHEDLYSSYLEK